MKYRSTKIKINSFVRTEVLNISEKERKEVHKDIVTLRKSQIGILAIL